MAASASSSSRAAGKASRSPESYDSLFRRNAAAEILQSYEKLSWHSFQRCESLVQTRLHFQNIVAGFTEANEAALVNWKEDKTPRPKPGEENQSNRKGKERASAMGADGDGGSAGASSHRDDRIREASTSDSAKKKRKSVG